MTKSEEELLAKINNYVQDEDMPEVEKLLSTHTATVAAEAVRETLVRMIDEKVTEVLGYYAEDVFTPASEEDFARINAFDANLNTRLHCSGIRHGLHQLRRAARELSARDDLEVIHVPALNNTQSEKGKQ